MLLTWGSSWESAGGAELLLFVPPPEPNLAHPLDQTLLTPWIKPCSPSGSNCSPPGPNCSPGCLGRFHLLEHSKIWMCSLRAWQGSIKVIPSPMRFLELWQILINLLSLNLLSHYLNGVNTKEETSSRSAGDRALFQILHLKKKPFYNNYSFQILILFFRFELLLTDANKLKLCPENKPKAPFSLSRLSAKHQKIVGIMLNIRKLLELCRRCQDCCQDELCGFSHFCTFYSEVVTKMCFGWSVPVPLQCILISFE